MTEFQTRKIEFRNLALGQETEFILTPSSPSFEFEGKPRHFVAIAIPENTNLTAIQIKSFLSTSFLPSARVVYPDFVFLDAERKVQGKEMSRDHQSVRGFWRSAISGRVAVPDRARYMIVVPGEGWGRATVYSENGTPFSIPPATLGEFSLRPFGNVIGQ